MVDNFPEDVEDGEVPPSKTPDKPKYRITKENARQFQLSSARAKKLRREARIKLLHGLVAAQAWEVVSADGDRVTLRYRFTPADPRFPGFPHEFTNAFRFETGYEKAREKYDRRIERFMKTL